MGNLWDFHKSISGHPATAARALQQVDIAESVLLLVQLGGLLGVRHEGGRRTILSMQSQYSKGHYLKRGLYRDESCVQSRLLSTDST